MIDKVLNIISLLILAILLTGFILIFGLGWSYSYNDGLGDMLYMLSFDFFSIAAIIILNINKHTRHKLMYYSLGTIFFIFMLSHYTALMHFSGGPALMAQPTFLIIFTLPIIILFWFLIRRLKWRYLFLLLFLTFPAFLVVKDGIEIYHFKNTCNQNTPKAWYDPIYLPIDFFHEEKDNNGVTKQVPNVVIVANTIHASKKFANIYGNIFYYNGDHPALDTQVIKKLFTTGNIVLYEKYQELNECPHLLQEQKTPQKYNCIPKGTKIRPLPKTVYSLNKDGSSVPVATFFAQQYIGTPFMRKLFPNHNKINCKYNVNDTYNNHSWYRRSEQAFENYIKLKK